MEIFKKHQGIPLCFGLNTNEFDCKCNSCIATIINSTLIKAYVKFRRQLDIPITVTCGYRCPAHNAEIGGAKLSRHTTGEGIDLALKEILQVLETEGKIIEKLKECGFTYIEINKERGYIHADTREV